MTFEMEIHTEVSEKTRHDALNVTCYLTFVWNFRSTCSYPHIFLPTHFLSKRILTNTFSCQDIFYQTGCFQQISLPRQFLPDRFLPTHFLTRTDSYQTASCQHILPTQILTNAFSCQDRLLPIHFFNKTDSYKRVFLPTQ